MKHIKHFESANMSPIFKKQVVYSVDCSDLSELIGKLYGHYPEIEASLELGHDDTFEIEANAEELDEEEFNEWLKKPHHERFEIYMLMNKLAFDGHIENGDYLIKTY
jgi:hypothetical protein